MPIVNRFARLLRADLNALVDRIEEPALVAREAVREMEFELAARERRAQALASGDAALVREDAHHADALTRLDSELDSCLAAGAEALARDLVRRKLEHAARRESLRRARERNAAARTTLAAAIDAARAELATLRARLAAHADAAPSSEHVVTAAAPEPGPPSEAEIDIALLREKERRNATGRIPV
ncbi:MAG: PspA/IM30 family protein [Gammaproteobacteria bacterium]